ncbi:MAG: hypothetical protein COU63_05030 [Candidatus Pacebacteria bacterium CG10_big_fil_rev_8_21_14_0_10_36_11]|nr:class I SAM-dependent methyltransferase [Candidatus Pacearchaeota archaeon]OIP73835.1 MAG: hypothetical protein AUK08_04740 [Candidatus Pacebacteria bacterium CG2_30_36_39]PIR64301.1 MAG: hypothetical protein COU63_05030 [Candidatus Pacebacteria bacterium CG10_big_fil_rev_8_21_14_0_10_36_11]
MLKKVINKLKKETKNLLEKKKLPDYFKSNQLAWNTVAPLHQAANHQSLLKEVQQQKYSCLNQNQITALNEIGVKNKKVFQPACNNGIELISIKKMGAKECVGFDIAEKFILQAQELGKSANVDCQFVQKNFFDISDKLKNHFDLVFVSVGTLPWMLDLNKFIKNSNKLLKKSGYIVINEMNPLLHCLNYESTIEKIKIDRSYFADQLDVNNISLDYYKHSKYKVPTQYCKYHTLAEIINTLIKNKFKINLYNEYPDDPSLSFQKLTRSNKKLPMSYTIIAQKI